MKAPILQLIVSTQLKGVSNAQCNDIFKFSHPVRIKLNQNYYLNIVGKKLH